MLKMQLKSQSTPYLLILSHSLVFIPTYSNLKQRERRYDQNDFYQSISVSFSFYFWHEIKVIKPFAVFVVFQREKNELYEKFYKTT
jgi:hypothetical protein